MAQLAVDGAHGVIEYDALTGNARQHHVMAFGSIGSGSHKHHHRNSGLQVLHHGARHIGHFRHLKAHLHRTLREEGPVGAALLQGKTIVLGIQHHL